MIPLRKKNTGVGMGTGEGEGITVSCEPDGSRDFGSNEGNVAVKWRTAKRRRSSSGSFGRIRANILGFNEARLELTCHGNSGHKATDFTCTNRSITVHHSDEKKEDFPT